MSIAARFGPQALLGLTAAGTSLLVWFPYLGRIRFQFGSFMAPFDILTSRSVRWMLPAYFAVATFYAWNVIPQNLCPEPLYTRLLQHLGL